MFFCPNCQTKNGWPTSYSRSFGKCEVCSKTDTCYDVPSAYLDSKK